MPTTTTTTTDARNTAGSLLREAHMARTFTNATLEAFRDIAAAMQTEPTDWQWIGPYLSQRMFGITRTRAEAYAQRHGGTAQPMQAAE